MAEFRGTASPPQDVNDMGAHLHAHMIMEGVLPLAHRHRPIQDMA